VIKKIQQNTLDLLDGQERPTIILGLSGGADSVFLFRALQALHAAEKISLIAVHINHGWRETATRDEQFCKDLCADYNIPIITEKMVYWDPLVPASKRNSGSKEADAREVRRIIFQQYQERYNAAYIALAHHADDQVETFFIRLIRGAGLTGLSSMRAVQDSFIRPLLDTTKAEILGWLAENSQGFCHDETNDSMAYLRNRIRNVLVPAFTACDARAITSTLRTITHLQEEDFALQEICTQMLESMKGDQGWYNTRDFLRYPSALRARMLISLLVQAGAPFTPTQALLEEIERFLCSPRGGAHQMGRDLFVEKKQSLFRITAA